MQGSCLNSTLITFEFYLFAYSDRNTVMIKIEVVSLAFKIFVGRIKPCIGAMSHGWAALYCIFDWAAFLGSKLPNTFFVICFKIVFKLPALLCDFTTIA